MPGRQRRAGLFVSNAPIMTDTTTPAAGANAAADTSTKAWSGRFSEPVSDLVKRYTASVSILLGVEEIPFSKTDL